MDNKIDCNSNDYEKLTGIEFSYKVPLQTKAFVVALKDGYVLSCDIKNTRKQRGRFSTVSCILNKWLQDVIWRRLDLFVIQIWAFRNKESLAQFLNLLIS